MNRNSARKWRAAAVAAGIACFVPAWADTDTSAAPQAGIQGPNPRNLAIAEAIQEYCRKSYPSSSDKWDFEVARLTRGASAGNLEALRASDAYRRARYAEATFVAQIEPVNAKHVCTRSLAKKSTDAKPADASNR